MTLGTALLLLPVSPLQPHTQQETSELARYSSFPGGCCGAKAALVFLWDLQALLQGHSLVCGVRTWISDTGVPPGAVR